jgi:hypothetical protein
MNCKFVPHINKINSKINCLKCGRTEEAHFCGPRPFGQVRESYRAVLDNVSGLERVQQHFSYSLQEIEQWAVGLLRRYPGGVVDIYIIEERLLRRVELTNPP